MHDGLNGFDGFDDFDAFDGLNGFDGRFTRNGKIEATCENARWLEWFRWSR